MYVKSGKIILVAAETKKFVNILGKFNLFFRDFPFIKPSKTTIPFPIRYQKKKSSFKLKLNSADLKFIENQGGISISY